MKGGFTGGITSVRFRGCFGVLGFRVWCSSCLEFRVLGFSVGFWGFRII